MNCLRNNCREDWIYTQSITVPMNIPYLSSSMKKHTMHSCYSHINIAPSNL